MNSKMIASLIAPLAFSAVIVGMSRPMAGAQKQQKATTFIRLGVGEHEEPAVNPELPAIRHDVEHYYDESSDRIMTLQAIEYEDGSSTMKLGPHKPEFDHQVVPLDMQPVPCTLAVQSATNQCNAATGTCHVDASVLCQQGGNGIKACNKVSFQLVIYKLEAGGYWKQENISNGQTPTALSCNTTAREFADAGVTVAGTYRFIWQGWDSGTGRGLWYLETNMNYAG
jgi:hypothetical protein